MASTAQQVAQALDLYQGDFLTGFWIPDAPEFDEWATFEQEQLHQRAIGGMHCLLAHYLASHQYSAGIDLAQRLLNLDAFDDVGHHYLLQLYTLNGQRNLALAHYQRYQHLLAQEIGVEPKAAQVKLYQAIRDGQWPNCDGPNLIEAPQSAKTITDGPKPAALDPYRVLSRLDPLPEQPLYGVEAIQASLEAALQKDDRAWLLTLEGIGGIGKTALAHSVVKEMAHQVGAGLPFVDIGWINTKPLGPQNGSKPAALDAETLVDRLLEQLLDRPTHAASAREKWLTLFQHLKERPTLIVINNLETEADCQALLPLLRHLAKPSKFLLTTRYSLPEQVDVYSLRLDELPQADALALLRFEAKRSGNSRLAKLTEAHLRRIYGLVGGNPLALKLVLGQIRFFA